MKSEFKTFERRVSDTVFVEKAAATLRTALPLFDVETGRQNGVKCEFEPFHGCTVKLYVTPNTNYVVMKDGKRNQGSGPAKKGCAVEISSNSYGWSVSEASVVIKALSDATAAAALVESMFASTEIEHVIEDDENKG